MIQTEASKGRKKYYHKNADFFNLVEKIKLWPSRKGTLHGIKSMTRRGDSAEIVTHCNRHFTVYNSRHSRASRWIRNKWFFDVCLQCRIPDWKLRKYSLTIMSQHYGVHL